MRISQEGFRLEVDQTLEKIEQAIKDGQQDIPLAITTIPPSVLTSDMDKINIAGLAVSAFTDYTGSSDEREVNLSIAASPYQGLVIPPGGAA